MNKYLLLFILPLLAACPKAPDSKPDAPVVAGARVDVAVREKCTVDLPVEPVWLIDTLPEDAPDFIKAKAALAELPQRVAYEAKIRAAAVKCN